ncbi:MAG: hypothetical protein AAF721_13275 [Myxococcota bacterium]
MTTPNERLAELIAADRAEFQPTAAAAAGSWDKLVQSVHAGAPAPVEMTSTATATGGSLSLGKLALVSTLVVGGGAVAVSAVSGEDAPRPTPAVAEAPADVPPMPSAPAPEASGSREQPTQPAVEEVAPPATPDAPRRARPKAKPDLGASLAAIQKANAALSRGDAAEALAHLRPKAVCRGGLAQDCRALRAIAACALGRAKASSRAQQFLTKYPTSIYADRVRKSCASD